MVSRRRSHPPPFPPPGKTGFPVVISGLIVVCKWFSISLLAGQAVIHACSRLISCWSCCITCVCALIDAPNKFLSRRQPLPLRRGLAMVHACFQTTVSLCGNSLIPPDREKLTVTLETENWVQKRKATTVICPRNLIEQERSLGVPHHVTQN